MEMREVSRRRWTAEQVLSRRRGVAYPPLLLGTSAITRVLADIAEREPVSLLGLADAAILHHNAVHILVAKLAQSGIISKLTRSGVFNAGKSMRRAVALSRALRLMSVDS